MNRPARRRSAWALLASLVLHAVLVMVLVFKEPPPPAPPPPSQALQVEIVEVRPPEPEPEKKAAAPQAAPPRAPSKKSAQAAAEAPAKPEPQPKPGGASAPKDVPRVTTLVPSSDFAIAAGGNGIEPEGPRGHTITNSPQEQPDPVAMREYTQEKLGRRTGRMVEGMVADTQARNGLVHPYFMGARAALEGDLSAGDVPLPKDKNAAREGFKGLLQNQERFGKTGSPFATGDEPKWNDYSLARNQNNGMAMQARDPEWAGIMRQAEQSMASAEAMKRVADHAFVEAILELVQEPGGGISDAHIVKSSGYRNFDEYVLHRARKVFLKLEDPPQTGHGISSAGWRTLWRFSYWPMSIAERRGQRVRVELLRVEKGQGSGNPLEHIAP